MICLPLQKMMKQRTDALKLCIISTMASVKTVNSSKLWGFEVLSAGKWLINKPEQEEQDITLDRPPQGCKL